MRLHLYFIIFCVGIAGFLIPAYANPIQAQHIEVELLTEVQNIQAGQAFWAAVRFKPDLHWHTYWRNPGDSGMPPNIEWHLPAGSRVSEVHWAKPTRIPMQHLMNFGYDGENWLLVQIHPPAAFSAATFPLRAEVAWLVCHEICVPGEAKLSLDIVVGTQNQVSTQWRSQFNQARAALPKLQARWQAAYDITDGFFVLKVQADTPIFAGAHTMTFFPVQADLIENAANQDMMWDERILHIRIQANPYFSQAPENLTAVLVVDGAAYEFTAQRQTMALPADFAPRQTMTNVNDKVDTSVLMVLFFALLGGLLLNLMPCVFPVLSLKALSLVGVTQAAQRGQGLFYTAGVVLSFIVVALILLILRAAGESIGWGFQLQSPLFIAGLSYLFFAMALSLSGMIHFGSRLMGVGERLSQKRGYLGSFFTGVLAAVVASPCTAPFMGSAIGIAVQQPPTIALLIFAALGFGMALPFLLLAFLPQLATRLPKPGSWMETFKQLMAFPLYATVIWLLWVLGRQTSVSGLTLILSGLLLLTFALWRWGQPMVGGWRWFNHGLASLSLLLALSFLASPLLKVPTHSTRWEAYTPQRLATLRQQQKPVFINLTADWCITCLVNEQTTLNTAAVQNAFAQHDIAYLKGDWTTRNPSITALLAQYGRNGVPLYVYYPPQGDTVVLPQILTVKTVLNTLR